MSKAIPKEILAYYPKLEVWALRKCDNDLDQAVNAVDDIYEKIFTVEISLDGVSSPYTYLVRCVENRIKYNRRLLKAKKRKFAIENNKLESDYEGNITLAELQQRMIDNKRRVCCTTVRVPESDYKGPDIKKKIEIF